jgi:membrane-bound metal-dependent hydrolase YbcI (DUF457 family)
MTNRFTVTDQTIPLHRIAHCIMDGTIPCGYSMQKHWTFLDVKANKFSSGYHKMAVTIFLIFILNVNMQYSNVWGWNTVWLYKHSQYNEY